jgi:hypothetical protein
VSNKLSKSLINININKDDSNLNDFLSIWDYFGKRPNKITIHTTYSTKLFTELMSSKFVEKNTFTEILADDEELIINDKVCNKISDGIYISYVVINRNLENSTISDLVFYYKEDDDFTVIQKMVEELNNCLVEYCEKSLNNLNTLQINNGVLDLEPIELDDESLENIELFYNQKTFKSVNKLIKKIKTSHKGLSVLWGEKGTGKTNVINYIASKLDRIVIYIPNNLIEHTVSSSEFSKLLKKYQKPIIIIDDCEFLFNDLFQRTNGISSNLTQIVDGFLSDILSTNIICIFNESDKNELDENLLDCNNFLGEVEFDYLTSDESNELSSYLEYNKKYKNKNKLIDIIKKRSTDVHKTFGF